MAVTSPPSVAGDPGTATRSSRAPPKAVSSPPLRPPSQSVSAPVLSSPTHPGRGDGQGPGAGGGEEGASGVGRKGGGARARACPRPTASVPQLHGDLHAPAPPRPLPRLFPSSHSDGRGRGREPGPGAGQMGGLALGALGALAAAALAALWLPSGGFDPRACERLQGGLGARVEGQDLALEQAAHAICDHLLDPAPERPLVLAAHGPPGVGKSLFHRVAAGALYGAPDAAEVAGAWGCPGAGCPAYTVLFGMDYLAGEREAQAAALRESLERHLHTYPEAFVVVEEYDKLDCQARGFFRQILDSGLGPGAARAVVLLESNAGYLDMHGLVAGGPAARAAVSAEEAQRMLKNVVFERYAADGCEERADTLKMVGLVHAYLPFLPLERAHLRRILARALPERLGQFHARARSGPVDFRLEEGPGGEALLDFLADKAEYDGAFALEGAKEVSTILSRYVTPQYRRFLASGGGGAGGHEVWVGLAEDGSGARFAAVDRGEGGARGGATTCEVRAHAT